MSYRVEYGKNEKKVAGRLLFLTVLFFLLFLTLVHRCWPEGASVVRRVLKASEDSVSVLALDRIAQKLGEGDLDLEVFLHFAQNLMP